MIEQNSNEYPFLEQRDELRLAHYDGMARTIVQLEKEGLI